MDKRTRVTQEALNTMLQCVISKTFEYMAAQVEGEVTHAENVEPGQEFGACDYFAKISQLPGVIALNVRQILETLLALGNPKVVPSDKIAPDMRPEWEAVAHVEVYGVSFWLRSLPPEKPAPWRLDWRFVVAGAPIESAPETEPTVAEVQESVGAFMEGLEEKGIIDINV